MFNEKTAIVESVKLSPVAGVKILSLLGFSLPDLVSLATLVYVLILISYKLWSWNKERSSYNGYKQKRGK